MHQKVTIIVIIYLYIFEFFRCFNVSSHMKTSVSTKQHDKHTLLSFHIETEHHMTSNT